MTLSVTWISTRPPLLVRPNTTGKPITSVHLDVRRPSTKILKSISTVSTVTNINFHYLLETAHLALRWAVLLIRNQAEIR